MSETISPGDIATALKNHLEGDDIIASGQECVIVEVTDHGEELVIAVEDENSQVDSFLIGISRLMPGPTPQRQTADLQKVLVEEFGGPTEDETAIGMAIRLLRQYGERYGKTPTRGEWCAAEDEDGRRCTYGATHTVDHHLAPGGYRWPGTGITHATARAAARG